MKKTVFILLMLVTVCSVEKTNAQTTTVKTVFTEMKCNELVKQLTDSLMQITGDVSKNFLKINEMTNRVAYQFVIDLGKDLGKPVSGSDFDFLWEQTKKCIANPQSISGSYKQCSLCNGSTYITCTVCRGKADAICNDCRGSGSVILNNKKSTCIICKGYGFVYCFACRGVGRSTCTKCLGSGYEKG